MADAGRLDIGIAWDGQRVCDVAIRSSRPQAASLLLGRMPEQVAQLVPMLFSLCGRAQGAAAQVALATAQGCETHDVAGLRRAVAREAMQEHLWRLLLDWPKHLGLEREQPLFLCWHAQLREADVPEQDIERNWLGLSITEWMLMPGLDAARAWWRSSNAPAACLFRALDEVAKELPAVAPRLLPELNSAAALAAGAMEWNGDFACRPLWAGRPAETGALAARADVPLLRDVLRRHPDGILARALARAYDMLALARGDGGRVDAVSVGAGIGLAVAQTARGPLLHRVRLDAGKVAEYVIVAPTEWNFHPQGALREGLLGMAAHDAVTLESAARRLVLALDPCVEYEIGIRRA